MKNTLLVLSFGFFSSLVLAQTTTKTDASNAFYIAKINGKSVTNMQTIISSAFNPKTTEWDIAWPGRISQYDLVYKSPPINPMQGIPLGNGDIGTLMWCEGSKIIIAVNKSDLWDDATFGQFTNSRGQEEDYSTTQRHACRIIIDFKLPVFNTLYLSGFKAKLNLADASLSLETTSPFGKVRLKAFVDHKSGVLFYDLSSDLNEDVPVELAVERFGSRTFSHWYHQINRDASIGLSGTETISDSSGVFITQKLSSGTFAVGGSVIRNNGLTVHYSREHSRCATIQLTGSRQKNVQLAFSVTPPSVGDPVSEVKNTLFSVRDKRIEPFLQSHAESWKSIWNRSFMDYGDDYLNNLWYLTMYYANASQGGKYPGRFNNGLWGWSHDVQQWNFYFHWNQQQLYWPLNAAGFHELVNPYLDFRFNSLPQAKKDAKEFFNADGAYISDITERRGYNSLSEKNNHTPVAEIALDFWRQYQYTGNKKFLKEKAIPFIVEAALFFESLLVKETDGLYHAKESTGYEGWIKLKDGLTDLVYARVLFTTALEALKVAGMNIPEINKWKDILDNLASIPLMKAGDSMISSEADIYRVKSGYFKGKIVPTNMITPGGWGIKEGKWLSVWDPSEKDKSELKWHEGIFPSVPSSTVYPSNFIGLGQKDKSNSLFQAVKATVLLYSGGPGWDPTPIALARIGLTDELGDVLSHFPERWQTYCNGWGQWGMEGEVKDAEYLIFRTAMVRDVTLESKNDEKLPLPMSPFRHMSMESMSVLATAMNESLLQSYDRTLRIFPAFPANKTGRFTLHAVGGFVVSSEIKSGIVQWICVKSLFGNPFRLELPWNKAVVQSNLKTKSQMISGNKAEIKTKADEVIMIFPEGQDLWSWSVVSEKPLANENVRYHFSGKTQLGIPRMF